MAKSEKHEYNSKTLKFGLTMAVAFYVLSAIMVMINTSENSIVDPDTTSITIAHWHLEDGYREGMDKLIELYEKMKAEQGIKVKVRQSTVPIRGYQQWFITQLISGDPADILLLKGASSLLNQYFLPLSDYIALPNPYNKGTPLKGMPWKDTYIDGMNSTLDMTYAEYFGIGEYFHVYRLFVNKTLLKQATGSDKMPTSLDEWLDDCRKLEEYGKKIKRPIIPIGVRGIDKSTMNYIFHQYFSQLNGQLNDKPNEFGTSFANTYEKIKWLANKELDIDRLLQAVSLTKEIGQYFCKGFSAMNLEQTKFLFFTGNVCFFPEGTWNAWSLVKNTPFDVGVINIPLIGPKNRFYKNFTGQISELGVSIGSRYGIPKASKHQDLALDFLHFLTSYKMNQMLMIDYCKWPPAIIKARYKGLLKKFKPVQGDGRLSVSTPFELGVKSKTKNLEVMEDIVKKNISEPDKYFLKYFIKNLHYLKEEMHDADASTERQLFDIAAKTSSLATGFLDTTITRKKIGKLKYKELMMMETLVGRDRQRYQIKEGVKALEKLEKNSDLLEDSSKKEVK